MQKILLSKNRKKILKTLALTRKILLDIAEETWGGSDYYWQNDYYYHSFKKKMWTDRVFVEKTRVKRAIYDLKKKKFVENKKIGERVYLILTDKGKQTVLKEQIRMADTLPKGEYCALSFDIPQHERGVRRQMLRLLKNWGFKMEHQSLWITNKEVDQLLLEYLYSFKADKWFHFYLFRRKS